MKIYLLHIDHLLEKEAIAQRMQGWPNRIREDILAFMQSKDYNASYWGKYLLQYAIQKHHKNLTLHDIQLSEKDRPHFNQADIDFNISHSGDYVTLAIDNQPIGIDIEKHRPVRIELFKRQFSTNEKQQIRQASNPQEQFFDFWSIKEAAIKADGRGVAVLSETEIISESTVQVQQVHWHYQLLPILSGYSYAVCSSHSISQKQALEIERLQTSELLNEI